MENVMEKTAVKTQPKGNKPNPKSKLKGYIAGQMRMSHFNEYYEERLEDEYLELSVLLNENTVYDFVSRNNNARSVHRQY
jgi:hypothetical protein